jgi:predicted DNA-binding transcriptional regulator AlpA
MSSSSTPRNDPTAPTPTVMLTRKDLAIRWKISESTVKRREKDQSNGYPKPIRIGIRPLRYREADILAYESQRQIA